MMDAKRIDLLRRIGALWRGDWSATGFDGRDGKRWINTALDGAPEELDALDAELCEHERDG